MDTDSYSSYLTNIMTPNVFLFSSASSAVIQLIIILILNKIYRHVAILLTKMEQPRTTTEYTYKHTMKVYLFEFVNFYASIFYLAFFKKLFGTYPGSHLYNVDKCDPSGCIIEVCIQVCICRMSSIFQDGSILFLSMSSSACLFSL